MAAGNIVIPDGAGGTSRGTRFRRSAMATAALLLLCIPAAAQQPTPLFNTPAGSQ